MTKPPRVSVIMSVYNAETYLAESIESILDQTYKDFELIVVNDGSTDRSLQIIKAYEDKRIKIFSHSNMGVAKSRNKAICLARGEYIAIQDSDDISSQDRLIKTVKFLDEHQDLDMVGGNFAAINARGALINKTDRFTHPDDLKLSLTFTNQMGHGSVLIRKSVLNKVGLYSEDSAIEDYDLWLRIAREGKIANLKDILFEWRYLDDSRSNNDFRQTIKQVEKLQFKAFEYYMKHKTDYRASFLIHPFSTRLGPRRYFEMKSSIYRNMALMYCYTGLRRKAVPIMIFGVIHAPWVLKNYIFIGTIVFRDKLVRQLDYEY